MGTSRSDEYRIKGLQRRSAFEPGVGPSLVGGALTMGLFAVSVRTSLHGEVIELEVVPSSNWHSKEAIRYIRNDDWRLAEVEFLEAVRDNPKDHRSFFGIAVCREKVGETILQASMVAEGNTNAPNTLSAKSRIMMASNPDSWPSVLEQYRKALEHYKKANFLKANTQYNASWKRVSEKIAVLEGRKIGHETNP